MIIASSTALRPSSTTPSTGTFSPGRTRRRSPGTTSSSAMSSSRPSSRDHARAFGREIEQGADRAAGLRAGAQFEHLAEQYQGDDDRRRLEIDRHRSVRHAERGGEYPRQQRRDQAVAIGDAGAERDQREHVEPAVDDRSPAAPEKRPPAPQHGRCRERPAGPRQQRRADQRVERRFGNVLAHGDRHQRDRQRHPDPEPPRHVAQLGVGGLPGSRRHRLERHAADRAAAGPVAHDLRMHRAGPLDLTGPRCFARRGRAQITRRIGVEPLAAPAAAEMVGMSRMLGCGAVPQPDRRSCRRPDREPAPDPPSRRRSDYSPLASLYCGRSQLAAFPGPPRASTLARRPRGSRTIADAP